MAGVGNMGCALSQRVWSPQPTLTEIEKVPGDETGGKMTGIWAGCSRSQGVLARLGTKVLF